MKTDPLPCKTQCHHKQGLCIIKLLRKGKLKPAFPPNTPYTHHTYTLHITTAAMEKETLEIINADEDVE